MKLQKQTTRCASPFWRALPVALTGTGLAKYVRLFLLAFLASLATAQLAEGQTTITFDKNGGTGGTNSVVGIYGEYLPSATAPTKVGYSFNGYQDNANGAGNYYYDSKMTPVKKWDSTYTGTRTLYASWIPNTYKVTFNANGGTTASPASKNVRYNNKYETLASTTRPGYTFDGWYTKASGGTQVLDTTTMNTAEDHTLWAHWTAEPAASIDSFTVTDNNPDEPGAMIIANPTSGTAPLATTLMWGTSNAASVSVSGPGMTTSTDASGSQTVTGLAAGTHTYTVTAQSQTSATLSWSVTGASTLTLVLPGGSTVPVTGETSYPATVAGNYTLKAANAFGTEVTSGPVTATFPAAKTASVTITVTDPQPVIPPKIDDGTIVVIPDPTNPGGIIIGGEIGAGEENSGQSQEFDLAKMQVVTTTDLRTTSEWPVAVENTHYTLTLNDDKTAFTLVIAPLAGGETARFYRVVTSTHAFNPDGTPSAEAGAAVIYNTTIAGQTRVTVPAGKIKLVANQFDGPNTVADLFDALPGRSTVGIVDMDEASPSYGAVLAATKRNNGNGWSAGADYALPVGYAALVTNASASVDAVLDFGGVVPRGPTVYALSAQAGYFLGSALPMTVANPTDTGYVLSRRDSFATMDMEGVFAGFSVNNGGTAWAGGLMPSFAIGEGYQYIPYADTVWQQTLTVIESTSIVQ
ncbi:MAG: InlB B-repeat-containing protein [Opitutaceae bacterium]|jgi:uncharacterized repeat protein (TIGR02543 family)|nr:InlB B-repeat-containing protein [Opitutaceae bacterium]